MNIHQSGKRVQEMAMADTVRNSYIALPLISLFEIIMIIRWFLSGHSITNTGNAAFLFGYIALLCVSVLTLLVIAFLGKDIHRNHRRINIMQTLYSVAIVLWTLEITYVGSRYNGYFDYLVYVTIVIIVPVFCFLSPLRWTPIQLISSAFVLHIASSHEAFSAFVINFSVFTIISIVASWAQYRARFASYQRQIDLEQERDQSDYHAYHDALTGLPNRRSYIQQLDCTKKDGLILAMFDINGLKTVNDTLGHDAGDELIQGAAECLVSAFSSLGTIYRVGGDEYTGIFYCTGSDLSAALQHFHEKEAAWAGKLGSSLSLSIGTAVSASFPDASIKELEIIADDNMYADKKAHQKQALHAREP